ncbi:MAG: DUF4956 domain-containing protein [Clostridia bacterium]|nr:DUF4956 domain-containing protein [Clostridia bacterium]MBO4883672.1 DUF4956 domain-containing protein [Clostridia bacterium]MBR4444041.1 DUF4956 domain-containing protein [Clostridia bacterium]
MTFNDIFKSSFLENVTAVSLTDMAIALVLSFFLGLFIFFVYKKTYSGVMFSQAFGGSLIAMTMITTMVILAVTSNVVLSLGMVGALSIVRFRTAIKEPMDIAFLFWAIAGGIVLAAGMIPLAIFGSVIIGVIMIVFCNRKSAQKPFIAVISCDNGQTEDQVVSYLRQNADKAVVKSKSAQKGSIELTYEVTLKNNSTEFITKLSEMDGVSSAVLVSYNGDYMG